MKIQKADRRSLRTQQLLSQSLMELMQEKRYDAITVQDILERANVGRSTFYAHYQDKEDLLISSLEKALDLFVRHIEGDGSGPPGVDSEAFFQHVKENGHHYHAMVHGRGVELLYDKVQAILSRKIEATLAEHLVGLPESAIPLPVIAAYLAGAFLNLMKYWLDHKMNYTPQQMSAMFQQLSFYGTVALLRPDR